MTTAGVPTLTSEGRLAFRFPLALSGNAALTETYDDDRGCYTIDVAVTNRWFGFLLAYRGTFTCDYPQVQTVPAGVKPVREEIRP